MPKDDDKRISIYVGRPLRDVMGEAENRSGRLNAVADRYLSIIADELYRIKFSKGEWCAIMDANNGVGMADLTGDTMSWQMMWANVADSPELDAKWEIDHAGLAGRMQAMTTAGRAAVYEACKTFWENTDLPTDEALAKAGIIPTVGFE